MALLKARDTIAGSLARCFVTIEGRRYEFMHLISFTAEIEIDGTFKS